MKKLLLGLSAVALLGGAAMAQRERMSAECRQQLAELCRQDGGGLRQCIRNSLPKLSDTCLKELSSQVAARAERPAGMREFSYGADPKQRLDLLVPKGAAKAPLLVFVHGGAWSTGDKTNGGATKGPWANAKGWAFASANYRLVPHVTVEQQAADLAKAVAWLRANAAKEGLDPDRIVLMGHSAGAHLVALLGTDTRYLQKAGVPVSAVDGVILLDGAAYDVPSRTSVEMNIVKPLYEQAIGTDPARQAALSPTHHAAAPNSPKWLILPIERRTDGIAQSHGLADALTKAGASATVVVVRGESHGSLNKGLGEKGDFATAEVERFLASAGR